MCCMFIAMLPHGGCSRSIGMQRRSWLAQDILDLLGHRLQPASHLGGRTQHLLGTVSVGGRKKKWCRSQ